MPRIRQVYIECFEILNFSDLYQIREVWHEPDPFETSHKRRTKRRKTHRRYRFSRDVKPYYKVYGTRTYPIPSTSPIIDAAYLEPKSKTVRLEPRTTWRSKKGFLNHYTYKHPLKGRDISIKSTIMIGKHSSTKVNTINECLRTFSWEYPARRR